MGWKGLTKIFLYLLGQTTDKTAPLRKVGAERLEGQREVKSLFAGGWVSPSFELDGTVPSVIFFSRRLSIKSTASKTIIVVRARTRGCQGFAAERELLFHARNPPALVSIKF